MPGKFLKAQVRKLLYGMLPRGRSVHTPPQTLLFLQYVMPLGCCVHDTPIYEAVRVARPGIKIVVATRGVGAATLQHNPSVDHVLITDDPLRKTWAVARQLRKQLAELSLTPDLVLTNANNQRTRLAVLARLIGQGRVAGFTLSPDLYAVPLTYDGTRSLIDNNLRLAVLAGASDVHREPRVFFAADDVAHARALHREANPNGKPSVIVVVQGSGGQRTSWHTDRWVTVLRHIAEQHQPILVGTGGDKALIDEIRSAAGVGSGLIDRTTVPQLAALVSLADYAVTIDTGTMHVARAAQLPMVVMGPSWQHPLEWLPLDLPNVRIVRGDAGHYNQKGHAPVPPNYHLDEIMPEAIIASFDDLVRNYPADNAARERRVASGLSAT